MNTILFLDLNSFWGMFFLVLMIGAAALGISTLFRKDSKSQGETLRKGHWLRKKKETENLT
jgi:hypothetical protein